MSTIESRLRDALSQGLTLAEYYEGGTVDRWFVAEAGIGLARARAERVSRLYRTERGARQFRMRVQEGR